MMRARYSNAKKIRTPMSIHSKNVLYLWFSSSDKSIKNKKIETNIKNQIIGVMIR